jgi:hypothetical protein
MRHVAVVAEKRPPSSSHSVLPDIVRRKSSVYRALSGVAYQNLDPGYAGTVVAVAAAPSIIRSSTTDQIPTISSSSSSDLGGCPSPQHSESSAELDSCNSYDGPVRRPAAPVAGSYNNARRLGSRSSSTSSLAFNNSNNKRQQEPEKIARRPKIESKSDNKNVRASLVQRENDFKSLLKAFEPECDYDVDNNNAPIKKVQRHVFSSQIKYFAIF